MNPIPHTVDCGVTENSITFGGCTLVYEESDKAVWILNISTVPEHRRKGYARTMLIGLANYCSKLGKTVYPGTFTDLGELCLKPLVSKLWPDCQF